MPRFLSLKNSLHFLLFPSLVLAKIDPNPGVKITADEPSRAAQVTEAAPRETARRITTETVFGERLFQGGFASPANNGFNPDYHITIGDSIQVMLWGAVRQDLSLTVDPQGNIFLPEIGPVHVQGISNRDLAKTIQQSVEQTYIQGVKTYASLSTSQPVQVYVSGNVIRPGLYDGFSTDVAPHFLDQAGGIHPVNGSYIDISLIREGQTIETINLYDFLTQGRANKNPFHNGDILLVNPVHHTVQFSGEVDHPCRFEFEPDEIALTDLLAFAHPGPSATHLSLKQQKNGKTYSKIFQIADEDLQEVFLLPDDQITLIRRSQPESIMINLAGAFTCSPRMVLPYGSDLTDALTQAIATCVPGPRYMVQLYRPSVAARQKALLDQSLDQLEQTLLATRSNTLEEAELRRVETATIQSFINRARQVEPKGQVVIPSGTDLTKLRLEDGDTLNLVEISNLINISGEVRFPMTVVLQPRQKLYDYLRQAGGFNANADRENIIIAKLDGSVVNLELENRITRNYIPEAGDEIMILSKPDVKGLQIAREIGGIIYSIGYAARQVERFRNSN